MNKPELVSGAKSGERLGCVYIMPERKTKFSAGYDFYCPKKIVIPPNRMAVIGTGYKIKLEPDEVLLLHIRSSMAFKRNLMMVNSVGVIDADYYNNEDNEGEILIGLLNIGNDVVTIDRGERFAQGIVVNYRTWGDEPENERTGGVGSTDRPEENGN